MSRFFKCLIILIILHSLNVSANFDFRLYRSELSPGETVQLELFFNNTAKDITPLNIVLYDQDNNKKPISPFLKKISERYLLYFNLPIGLEDGSYKLLLKDIVFKEQNILTEKSFEINLTVKSTEQRLSISPALLYVEKNTNNFGIKVKNNGVTTSVKIDANELLDHPYTQSQIIQQNTERLFKFKIKSLNRTRFDELKISYGDKQYIVPIIFKIEESKEEAEQIAPFELLSDIVVINKTIKNDQTVSGYLSLRNNMNEPITLAYKISGNIKDITDVELADKNIPSNATAEVKITINKDKLTQQAEYSGYIEFDAYSYAISIPLYIKIVDEPATAEEREQEIVIPKKEEKKGEKEIIDLNFTVPKPPEPEKPKQTWMIILILLLLIFAIIYYLSKRKTIKQKTFGEYIRGIEKK
ncbi:MAG: hypothetical protein AABY07_05025 [Nanoarchaeota archaeon]